MYNLYSAFSAIFKYTELYTHTNHMTMATREQI